MAEPFHRLVATLDYPMTIVTAAAVDDGERSGCLVGFTTQCSVHPPRWLACLSKKNHTHDVACRADMLVVHLPSPAHADLATLFGEETGDEVDKFSRCSWRPGPDGRTPVLDGLDRWLAGRVLARWDVGDHTAFLLDVVEASFADGGQLGFQSVKDMDPGHPV